MSSELYEKWKSEYAVLKSEISQFRDYFINVKECSCGISECQHFKKARHQIFGKRIDELFNLKMQSSFKFYNEIRSR